jgi:hypothetical protein
MLCFPFRVRLPIPKKERNVKLAYPKPAVKRTRTPDPSRPASHADRNTTPHPKVSLGLRLTGTHQRLPNSLNAFDDLLPQSARLLPDRLSCLLRYLPGLLRYHPSLVDHLTRCRSEPTGRAEPARTPDSCVELVDFDDLGSDDLFEDELGYTVAGVDYESGGRSGRVEKEGRRGLR